MQCVRANERTGGGELNRVGVVCVCVCVSARCMHERCEDHQLINCASVSERSERNDCSGCAFSTLRACAARLH